MGNHALESHYHYLNISKLNRGKPCITTRHTDQSSWPLPRDSRHFKLQRRRVHWTMVQYPNLPFFWMDGDNYCPWANYTKWSEVDPSVPYDIKVVNSEINYRSGVRDYSVGNAYINQYEPGTLDVAFGPVEPSQTGTNYQVIATDNVNYSYVWNCDDICNSGVCQHQPLMWILNRDPNANQQQEVENAMKVLASTGYDPTKVFESMIYSNQEGCTYDLTTDIPSDYHGPVTIGYEDF